MSVNSMFLQQETRTLMGPGPFPMSRDITLVELGRLFSNHGEILTLPQIRFGYQPRRGRACGTEVVRAISSLVARTGRVEHSLEAIVDEMSSLGSSYAKDTVRRVINYDLTGRHTPGHVSRARVIRSATGYRLRDGAAD